MAARPPLCDDQAFKKFDRDNSGQLDLWELTAVLQVIDNSKNISEDDLLSLINTVDEDGTGTIDMDEFIELVDKRKNAANPDADDQDTVDTFVALGGNPDKSGEVNTERLRKVFKDFKLSVDIDALISSIDTDSSGYIDYEEFRVLLSWD